MVAGSALISLNDALLKWLATDLPVGQLLFVRGCFALGLMALVAWRVRLRFRIINIPAQTARALLTVASTFAFITGLRYMPLAEAIAIAFAGPLFVTLLAALLLREQVGWRRWSAVAVGFCGVLIILRPGDNTLNWAALFPLGSSLGGALRDIITRKMSTTESSFSTLVFTTLVVTTSGLCTLPFGWPALQQADIALLACASLLVASAHFLLIETFRLAEASLVAPFKYLSIVWGTLYGVLIWGELPGVWVWLGSALLISSGLYIFYREARHKSA
jgi:drug/metabolite transporter (DMT)-like permease